MKTKKVKDVKKGCIIGVGPKRKWRGKVTAISEPYAGGARIEFQYQDGKLAGKSGTIVLDHADEISYFPVWKEKKVSQTAFWFALMLGYLLGYGSQLLLLWFPHGVF